MRVRVSIIIMVGILFCIFFVFELLVIDVIKAESRKIKAES